MPRISAAAAAMPHVSPMRLAPPAELGEAERVVFRQTVAGVRPDHFLPEDIVLLASYARAACIERKAAEVVAAAPGAPTHDELAAWRDASKILLALSIRLRIGPRARDNHPRPRSFRAPAVVSYYDLAPSQRGGDDEVDEPG